MTVTRPQVLPIDDGDVAEVASYLHERMNPRVTVASWTSAMCPAWQRDAPNHGFHLRCAGAVVGAYVALYSVRMIGDSMVRCCNLAAWCVDPDVRFSSTRLLRALLDQDGYVFIDLSPSGNVVSLNERSGFRHLDTTTAVLPTVPVPSARLRSTITTDLDEIDATLEGADLQIFRDHRRSPAVRHALLASSTGTCHVMYRRDRRRNLPLFASVLRVSDREVFAVTLPKFTRHVLWRDGIPVLLGEERVIGYRLPRSFTLDAPRPKMVRSDTVDPADVDNLYSELTELVW